MFFRKRFRSLFRPRKTPVRNDKASERAKVQQRDGGGRFVARPKHAFVDESGDLGASGKSDRYFVIGSAVTANPKSLQKIVSKYPKNTKRSNVSADELKFSTSAAAIKGPAIIEIINNGTKTFAVITDKKSADKSVSRSGKKLYSESVEELLILISKNVKGDVHVILDENTALTEGETRAIFGKIKKKDGKKMIYAGTLNSQHEKAIQAADLIVGGIGHDLNATSHADFGWYKKRMRGLKTKKR
ncbi:MAG: DUF3800 domain-containing protein [Candidatus Methanomethylophilaceae archaeon]